MEPEYTVGITPDDIKKGFADFYHFDNSVAIIRNKWDFQQLYGNFENQYGSVIDDFGRLLNSLENPGDAIQEMSDYFLEMAEAALPKSFLKGSKKASLTDDALYMVTYFFPALSARENEMLNLFARVLATAWADRFGGAPLGVVGQNDIAAGFRPSLLGKLFSGKRDIN